MKNTAVRIENSLNQPGRWAEPQRAATQSPAAETAKKLLAHVMGFRRMSQGDEACAAGSCGADASGPCGADASGPCEAYATGFCEACASSHLPKVLASVQRGEPVTFVLPAFPGKSPNLEKVLGPLPDHAERISLQFLGKLCLELKRIHAPGVKIILCSDGRVFSDVVGMKEHDVTAYQIELDRMKEELSLTDIETWNLDDCFRDLSFSQMREELMKRHGSSLDFLKHKVRGGSAPSAAPEEREAHRMYCGITRFLFEDSLHERQTKSRTAIQKESRTKAYEVIRRSNAWSELIAQRFPEAVRLSIHPQACGSRKLGIRLVGKETWMTPWHGVALETPMGYQLVKRSEALSLGAELLHSPEGRPSHFRLKTSSIFHEEA